MLEIWQQLKIWIFQRNFFKLPLWLWLGPVSILLLSCVIVNLQPAITPLALFFAVIGIFFSSEFKIKGVGISAALICLFSLIFIKEVQEPMAVYWLYVFGLITSFLITAYAVEEYESFIVAQAEDAKKNFDDVKLWQTRFEGNQIRLEREKERFEKINIDFQKQEESYLEKIDQMEKMFHASTYELKQEQNRGYQLHQELKKLLIERYEIYESNQVAIKELENLSSKFEHEKEILLGEIELLKSELINKDKKLNSSKNQK